VNRPHALRPDGHLLPTIPILGDPLIDVHTHVVPPDLIFRSDRDERWPRVVRDGNGDGADVIVAGKLFRRIDSRSWDLERRCDDMDRHGVRLQVLSPIPELFSYWADVTAGEDYCRAVNDWIAAQVSAGGGRFHGLGIVPLQDVDRAVALLQSVSELGLRGVEIGTSIEGFSAADHRYEPFYQEAARLGLAVLVHAFRPRHAGIVTSPEADLAVTFPAEVGFTMAALVANGILVRAPGLRLCASHGGGTLALGLSRLQDAWTRSDRLREALPEAPWTYAQQLYYDTLTFDPHALDYLAARVGTDRIVVGSDYPGPFGPPGATVRESRSFHADALGSTLGENAAHFLGLDAG
jgi:aminocarboxymuconate-semialdehyde decarboxylase